MRSFLLVTAAVIAFGPVAFGAAAGAAGPDPYAGLKTVAVENDRLRMVVLPGIGGRIAELHPKPTGANHLLLDPAALKLYRQMNVGEGFLLMGGGLFDVVVDNGRRGYPGSVQCAPYQVVSEKNRLVVTCTRGAVEVTRRMTLGDGVTIEVTYRNVSKAAIRTGVGLRAEFRIGKGRRPLVAARVKGGRLGLYDAAGGMGRIEPGAGWIVNDPGTGEKLLIRFDPAEVEFVRGYRGTRWATTIYALTLLQKQRTLPPGKSVTLKVGLHPFNATADAVKLAGGDTAAAKTLKLVLDNLGAVDRRYPRGQNTLRPWGLVTAPRLIYSRKRPWARAVTEYAAGDDVRLVLNSVAFVKKPPVVMGSGVLYLPDGRTVTATAQLTPGGSASLVFSGREIGAVSGPFAAFYALTAGGEWLLTGKHTVRYHHRGDPRVPHLLAKALKLAARVREQRGLKHAALALPWIDKRIEYAVNLQETGDYRYRPFCHGKALAEAYGSTTEAIHLLRDAIDCAETVLAGRDPAAGIKPGGHVFCYDLARHGAKIVAFKDAAFARKLAAFKTKVDALAQNPQAAKDAGWYRALYLLGPRALDHGIRADDGDAAAAAARMTAWLDDILARVDKWPDDGWKKGKFRFPFGGLIKFHTENIERHRGYSVYVPSAYDGKTARPVLVDPNSYGNLLSPGAAWTVPTDPDPVTRLGAAEAFGYFLLGPGHTNTYSRSGNPQDVRRVIDDAATFLRMDRSRFYCTGGSLNADATGNLGNSMLDTWAAVAPYSQGAQLWTKKTAKLPRVTFQAGAENRLFVKGIQRYREWGVYDPAIHLGGLYPGAGHCGMSHDMWQFVFEFFARHRRPR